MVCTQISSPHCWLSSPCNTAGGVLQEIWGQLPKIQVPLLCSVLASDQCAGHISGKCWGHPSGWSFLAGFPDWLGIQKHFTVLLINTYC